MIWTKRTTRYKTLSLNHTRTKKERGYIIQDVSENGKLELKFTMASHDDIMGECLRNKSRPLILNLFSNFVKHYLDFQTPRDYDIRKEVSKCHKLVDP